MHLSLPLQHFLHLLWFDKVKMRLLHFTLIIWRTQNLRNSWDVFPEAEWFPHRSAGSRSALDSRSWILPGESSSARSVVGTPVELVTPPGQRGQAAHFWSRCLFRRALSGQPFWLSCAVILAWVRVFLSDLADLLVFVMSSFFSFVPFRPLLLGPFLELRSSLSRWRQRRKWTPHLSSSVCPQPHKEASQCQRE